VKFAVSLVVFAVLGSYLVLLMPPKIKRKLQLAAARAKRAKLDRSPIPSHASVSSPSLSQWRVRVWP